MNKLMLRILFTIILLTGLLTGFSPVKAAENNTLSADSLSSDVKSTVSKKEDKKSSDVKTVASKTEDTVQSNVLRVGASATPHAEILEFVKPMLEKKGIKLKIITFQDYILPNKALAMNDLDANYYQHTDFLNEQNKEYGYNLTSVAKIHLEPMAIYSKRYKSLSDIQDKDTIIMSNSVADRGRNLILLENAGLIKLKHDTQNVSKLDFSDIIENPKELNILDNIDPAFLPTLYTNDEAALIIINANYALGIKLNPTKDSLYSEKSSSPYANILVVNEKNKDNKNINELVKALKSKETQDFINKKYQGAIIPIK